MFSTIWDKAMQFWGWFRYCRPTARHASTSQLTQRTHPHTVCQLATRSRHHGAHGEKGTSHHSYSTSRTRSTAHGARALGPSKPLREQSQTHWITVWDDRKWNRCKLRASKKEGPTERRGLTPRVMLRLLRGLSERGRQAGWVGVTHGANAR